MTSLYVIRKRLELCKFLTFMQCFFNLLSISSTFYAHVFCTKFWGQKITKLKQNYKAEHFSFVIFGRQNILKTIAHKMLMKLTTCVDSNRNKLIYICRRQLRKSGISGNPQAFPEMPKQLRNFLNCLGNWGKPRHFRKCLGYWGNSLVFKLS